MHINYLYLSILFTCLYLQINEFLDIVSNYTDVADSLIVYIQEAHPLDKWYFDFEKNKRHSHTSLEDRIEAGNFLKSYVQNVPIVVDNMRNGVCDLYGAKPERLYVIKSGQIVYQGGWGTSGYKLEEMEVALKKFGRKN